MRPSRSRIPSPGGATPGRRPESVSSHSSILDWASTANKAPFPGKQAPSAGNAGSIQDAASSHQDDGSTTDLDKPPFSPAGSMGRGTAGMGLAPERPAAPPAEPKSSKMRSNILVAVRMRPLSDKEKSRGDHEMWFMDEQNNIGCYGKDGSFVPKHRYDTVFGKQATNLDVHAVVARPLIAPALVGISGTVFAYGVTSSGKTHTMMGGYSEERGAEPGIVPNVVRELFSEIEKMQSQLTETAGSPYYKQYSVRLSMMEIYNEVINDLLQPGQVNLKLLEVGSKGLVVDGLCEEPVGSAEDALELIAQGDAYRKVSSTAYNEDSSRSHTICRLHVDTMEVPATGIPPPQVLLPRLPQQGGGRRTAAVLSLIDLAGSESAKVNQSKGQRMEGSFINKSLLTLGTVIHKLADARGHQQSHVPYRDSKLTRLLQSSMSGSGARIAIVCNITPAAAQFEETGNTLKFATRAKLVQVAVSANDVMDDRTLVRRYRQEAAELRKQLTALLALQNSGQALPGSYHPSGDGGHSRPGAGGADGEQQGGNREAEGSLYGESEVAGTNGDWPSLMEMESELMDLKYQLEQERSLRTKAEQDKTLMETRLRRLTMLLLEKQRQFGSLFRTAQSPTTPANGAANQQQHQHQPPQQQPQQLQQDDEIAKQGREVYAALAKAAQDSPPAQQPQEEQQQQHSTGAERPPTPPLQPGLHPGQAAAATNAAGTTSSLSSPHVRNGRFIRPNAKGHSRAMSQQMDTASLQQDKSDSQELDDDEAEAELLAQIEALHGELTASKRSSGHGMRHSASSTPITPLQIHQQPWEGSGNNTGTHTPTRGGPYGRGSSIEGDYEKDLEIQVLLADHEVLQDQIVTVEMSNQRLVNANEQLAAEVAWYKLENEKERRIVRELESDMDELRRFKNETYAQLEALKAEAAEARGRRASGVPTQHAFHLPRPGSFSGTPPASPMPHFTQGGLHIPSSMLGTTSLSSSQSFSSAAGHMFDTSGFGELRAHMASGNEATPELMARLEALEKHVVTAVGSVIARNKQLETQARATLADPSLQGLEGLSAGQRTQRAIALVQAASRLTQGLSKADQAMVSSALQPVQAHMQLQAPPPLRHATAQPPLPHAGSAQDARLAPPPHQGGPVQRVSMEQVTKSEHIPDGNVLVEWDLLSPEEGAMDEEDDEGAAPGPEAAQ